MTVSDEDTEFLNTLRYFFDNYPNIDKHDKSWDVAGAVYHALFAFPESLIIREVKEQLPDANGQYNSIAVNPFADIGSHKGY